MYYRPIIFSALLAVILSACATVPVNNGGIERLEQRLATQQEELNLANSQIEELGLKLLLLQEKSGVTGVTGVVVPDEPPTGLAVVELRATELPDVVLKEKQPDKLLSIKLSKDGIGKVGKKSVVNKKSKKRDEKRHKKKAVSKRIDPKGLYAIGQNLFLDGRYVEARAAFGRFIKTYPKNSLADNALYWTGEAHYLEKRYGLAVKSFLKIADFYPNENKAPVALLKAGQIYIETEDYVNAGRLLKRLVSSYPDSVEAGKAERTLKTVLSHKKEGPK